jgi:menaquinol-cytochrome c reductase iron-sulfur subunit
MFHHQNQDQWIDFGTLDAIPMGKPQQLTASVREKDGWYEREVQRAVWVIRKDNQQCTVFHPRCTHLGCAYRWDNSNQQFACPCHGGTYDIAGRVISGPPPRALDELPTKIKDGKLLVQFV